MLNNSTTAAPARPDRAAIQLPSDPELPWPDYLDRVASLIQDAYPGDPRAWFVAALVRESATVAHLHGLRSHFEHQQFMLDPGDDPVTESGPAAPIAHGCLAGHPDRWDMVAYEEEELPR